MYFHNFGLNFPKKNNPAPTPQATPRSVKSLRNPGTDGRFRSANVVSKS